jgi:hypothetical protein
MAMKRFLKVEMPLMRGWIYYWKLKYHYLRYVKRARHEPIKCVDVL